MPSPPSPVVRVRVPAKINLHLSVGAVRDDGFHDLRTVFHAVDLVDEIVVSAAGSMSLSVTGRTGGVPVDSNNLAWRAVELLAEEIGIAPAVRIRIHKRIPVAGGMAGGSADAAGALLACNALWQSPVAPTRLEELALELGSDVSFPLVGGTAVGTGRGEVLAPVACPPLHWVLVPAAYGISAGDAYRELDRLRGSGADLPAPMLSTHQMVRQLTALASSSPDDGLTAATLLHNDLQAAAVSLRPELADVLASAHAVDAVAWTVSGSGPTCAFLMRTRADADRAALALNSRYPGAVAASGPVSTSVCVP